MSNAATKAALNKIAEGIYELADAMFQDAPGATTTAYVAPQTVTTVEASPFVDLPDEVFAATYEPVGIPAADPVLSVCPNHGTPWTVKAAGVSKAGKPYQAFFKCDGKNPDGAFCQKKPTREWADAHAARLAAA